MNENQQENLSTPPHTNIDVDWFLQFLVRTVTGTDMLYSITLNVGGLLVTGELVGGHKYFEGISDALRKAGMDSESSDMIKNLGEKYIKEREKQQESDSDTMSPPIYIHLRNARIFSPDGGHIPTGQGVWWRGRLKAVDGFNLGLISIE